MDRHTQSRLKNELVIWLVTAGRDRRPQAVPVWFYWDGSSFLIYAVPGVKVRHVRENPYVELHLNADEVGNQPPAHREPGYARKYRQPILALGMTVEAFAAQYLHPIRVRRLRFH